MVMNSQTVMKMRRKSGMQLSVFVSDAADRVMAYETVLQRVTSMVMNSRTFMKMRTGRIKVGRRRTMS